MSINERLLNWTNEDNFDNFDPTNYSFANMAVIWTVKSSWEVVIKTFAISVLLIVSVGGNSFVLWVIVRTKKLHTPTNWFLFNLAVADLLNSTYSTWTLLVDDIFQNFILGPVFCRLNGFVGLTCMLSGVFSLTAISCDRVKGIVSPFSRRLSKRVAAYIMGGVWLFAMTLASPTLIYRKYIERQWSDYLESFCTEQKEILRIYWLVLLLLLVWFPMFVMSVAYSFIIVKITRYEEIISNVRNHKKIIVHRKKVIKMLFLILVVFFFSWLPFQVVILFRYFRNSVDPLPSWHSSVSFVAHYLALLPCALHPFIYGISSENFRLACRMSWWSFLGKKAPKSDFHLASFTIKQNILEENGS